MSTLMQQHEAIASTHLTPAVAAAPVPPRIYYLHPLLAGPLDQWPSHLQRAAGLGFSHVLIAPPFHAADLFLVQDFDRPHEALGTGDDALFALRRIAALCEAEGLAPLLDVMPDHVAAGARIAQDRPDLFRSPDPSRALDPRSYAAEGDVAVARWQDAGEAVAGWWVERLAMWRDAGFGGFRLTSLRMIPPAAVRHLAGLDTLLLGWTPGLAAAQVATFAGCGLNYVFNSLPWWDFRADWFWTEAAALRRIARVLAPVEAPFGRRLAAGFADPSQHRAAVARAAGFAAGAADGWLMPMGVESLATDRLDPRRETPSAWQPDGRTDGLAEDAIRAANAQRPLGEAPRPISAPGADAIIVLRRSVGSDAGVACLANASLELPAVLPETALLEGLAADAPLGALRPGEVRTVTLRAPPPVTLSRPALPRSAELAARAPRIGIERVAPSVDGGRFAAKRIVGDIVSVTADVICDGHDQLGVALLWRSADAAAWQETRMRPLGNDVWEGAFPLTRCGRWTFTIEAWRDGFATFRDELTKKTAAGVNVELEVIEGSEMVAAAAQRVPALAATSQRLGDAAPTERIAILLAGDTASRMMEADARPFAVRLAPPCLIDADRQAAQFASWYEIFPRSMSDDERRHGTFADVIRHLPRIRDMGFDVLYFPPIHPIGRRNRKGRNNTLQPAPDDPGSPYAIGDAAGGHDAIHPELGTLGDFAALREAASEHGLELALDFAIQCSPDHPWLRQHREWFDWRPDGSLRYAENPPKKYEDIVNVDFYAPAAVPDLWVALCEVVLFWAEQGVRIFRVDNPHTKPFPFWEWLIAEVRADFPDTLFLAEAFTRPKVMNRLGKIGFSQSYTYFTWRNNARELQEYLTELTTRAAADFFRPNFFVNTPDINPLFLQGSGRAGFLIRAALAATLSGLWGVYCGFELCEAAAVPGREEYADSEKYQLRAWDWQRPGNIVADVTALNAVRRRNPALQTQLGVRFVQTGNDQVLAYEKATADRSNVILVVVSLDPFGTQYATVAAERWRWAVPDAAALLAEDLVGGGSEFWPLGARSVTLTPERPYALWRLRPQ